MRLAPLLFGFSFCLAAQTPDQPVRGVTDPGVVTTRQTITPAGVPAIFDGRVYGVAFGAADSELWVLGQRHVYRLDWRQNRVLGSTALEGTPALQGLAFDRAGGVARFAAAQRGGKAPQVFLLHSGGEGATATGGVLGTYLAGALAVAPKPDPRGRRIAVVPVTKDNRVAVIDLVSGQLLGKVQTSIAPFAAVINQDGTEAWVSNWGGRAPRKGEPSAPAGMAADSDRVLVDARGIAASGTVMRIDLAALQPAEEVSTGLHPTALAWDLPAGHLYVADTNSDSVTVVNTRSREVEATWTLQPFAKKAEGIAPTALALSSDGTRLYVACGGINAVAVLDTRNRGRLLGMIPTAWYPNALSLSGDGRTLAVGSLLGAGSGWQGEPKKRYVHSYRGAVAVIALPDASQLAAYTRAVAENNHLPLAGTPAPPPERAAGLGPIRHVVFIIKENRTYDQVLGDVGKGNGDPSMVMFGEDVTPNHHRLANGFTLLDNFYATGGNSADGHQWVTQANETSYALWPGYTGRSYPFDGTDPIAYSRGGFLWDAALAAGKTVRVFGEYAGRLAEPSSERLGLLERWRKGEDFTQNWKITAPIAGLNRILARNYPPYTNSIPDVIRAQIFLSELKQWESAGSMPDLVMMLLNCDHTMGTTPNVSTPKAMVADNDLALGRVVEGLTHSRFWKEMAIFVVEDDAQAGVDHVDGHRTVALAVSPYVRRDHIDSTFYSHQSILKTIELILGLPHLSLFDLIANDMRASFQAEPDFTPYTAAEPRQSLFDMNPALKTLRGQARRDARDSAAMRWDVPDAVPSAKLNRILWRNTRGLTLRYPETRNAVFAPLAVETDEDEDDEDAVTRPARTRPRAGQPRR